MIDTVKQGGGAVRSTRILIGIAAAVAACLFLAAGSASAKTVYKYVYSGEFIDGSGSSKGQFKAARRDRLRAGDRKAVRQRPGFARDDRTSSTRTAPPRISAPSTTAPAATTSTSANRAAANSRSTPRTTRPPKATSTSVGESCSVTTRTDCRSNPRSTKPSSAKRANRVAATFSPAAGPSGRTANTGTSHRATGSRKSTSAISKPSKRK